MKTIANHWITIVACLGSTLFCSVPASACTGIRLTAKDGTTVYARTLELGGDLDSNIIVVPRLRLYRRHADGDAGAPLDNQICVCRPQRPRDFPSFATV